MEMMMIMMMIMMEMMIEMMMEMITMIMTTMTVMMDMTMLRRIGFKSLDACGLSRMYMIEWNIGWCDVKSGISHWNIQVLQLTTNFWKFSSPSHMQLSASVTLASSLRSFLPAAPEIFVSPPPPPPPPQLLPPPLPPSHFTSAGPFKPGAPQHAGRDRARFPPLAAETDPDCIWRPAAPALDYSSFARQGENRCSP
eukprot:766755-Hanusia_phi.AAC.4